MFCRFFLGIANVYHCYGNWEAGTRRWQWLFWCYANFIVWITVISCTEIEWCAVTTFEDITISVMPGFLWDTVYIGKYHYYPMFLSDF